MVVFLVGASSSLSPALSARICTKSELDLAFQTLRLGCSGDSHRASKDAPCGERLLVEQDMGVEPMSLAWKAKVIAVIPILQQIKLYPLPELNEI